MDFPSLIPQNYTGFVPRHRAQPPALGNAARTLANPGSKDHESTSLWRRFGGWLNRMEQRHWERSLRAREAYLAASQNMAELESRMRHFEHDDLFRDRPLP
jgi:hypothetical protein